MKKVFLFLLAALLLLAGCSAPRMRTQPPSEPESFSRPPLPPLSEETLPPHSDLFLEGLSTDTVILYFEEICLDAEIINSGDPSRLQKWAAPILYQVLGDLTQEDREMITKLTRWLNTIPGFPGMREVGAEEAPSMNIFFCSQEEMAEMLGDWTLNCDGGVTFWYDMDEIYSATICIRTDLDQELRNSVILEEIYNSLGPVQDSDLREDSIIWSGYSQPQWLTEEDILLLTLLYHPDLEPGMNSEQCAEAIRRLYY